MKNTNVFGITFSEISITTLADNIVKKELPSKIIVTPNVDHVVRFHKLPEFRSIYSAADIYVNDSRILMKLSRYIGKPIQHLVPGSDLTKLLMSKIEASKNSICIIGGSSSTINTINNNYKLEEISHHNPPMGFIEDENEVEKCIDFCLSSKADIVFLAIGSPQQEVLAKALKEKNISSCVLCIGASLLFLSGEEKRAPEIFQDFSLEWLYRLSQSPRRLAKRYLLDGPYIFKLAYKERVKIRKGST